MSDERHTVRQLLRYQTARGAIAWLPIFFLYMSARLSVRDALLLEAIYYAAVVVAEVPSGYFSDRVGRRPTLVAAMALWVAACIAFAIGPGFAVFATAQVLMAMGMAFHSGTDEAMLFDTLAALGEQERFVEIQAQAETRARAAAGVAALIGGVVSIVDFRAAYGLSAVAAALAGGFAWRMHEPNRIGRAASPLRQLGDVGRQLRDRCLTWLLVFAVAMTVFDHVAYMFVQPYLQLLSLPQLGTRGATPLASGVVTALTLALSAMAAAAGPRVLRRCGRGGALLLAMAAQGIIVTAMALFIHPVVVIVIVMRSMPPAIWRPIAHGVAHPRVPSQIRATYFSVESLAGRLSFSATLAVASASFGAGAHADPDGLASVLGWFGGLIAIAWVGLALTVRALGPASADVSP